jgi:hypothetical protein
MWPERKSTGRFAWLALFIMGMFVITIPVGYYLVAYNNLSSKLETEAEVNANQISRMIISLNPGYWQLLEHRLSQYLTGRPEEGQAESRRILTINNEVVAESSDELEEPVITKLHDLTDSGVVVGRLEITASLMPIMIETGLLFLCVFPFGALGFAAICYFPIKRIEMAEKAEQESRDKLEIAYKELQAEMAERKLAEAEREKLISELKDALAEVRQLSLLLPICANCKKIRDDRGYWNQLEVYLSKHSGIVFTHGICPECSKKLYPDADLGNE